MNLTVKFLMDVADMGLFCCGFRSECDCVG
jgi:hypothetical protein